MNEQNASHPHPQGLYDPQFEHDACGVGFVAHIKGKRSHSIIKNALIVLEKLEHRGACGCDDETGDGAGILFQIPHKFYAKELAKQGITLPNEGAYGVGMIFLPKDAEVQTLYRAVFNDAIREEGQKVIAWRKVPVDSDQLGWLARSVEPGIEQVFIQAAEGADTETFERILFLIRRRAQNRIVELKLPNEEQCYVCSLSSKTIVYKGLMLADRIEPYYLDLSDPDAESALAIVHQRFSTNTFPTWDLAHPYRYIAHNGEINTLRGNRNWMRAREKGLKSDVFGDDLPKLFPLVNKSGSDSATLDNAVELLTLGGRSLMHVMLMLIPEAWQNDKLMSPAKRAFYEFHACKMEPWDGPAAVAFTDGVRIGAVLDRNGLRPARYMVTADDIVVMASETGVYDTDPANVVHKGRLQPGKVFLIDTEQGRIVSDEELKAELCSANEYEKWLDENLILLDNLPKSALPEVSPTESLLTRQQMFGYTLEDLKIILAPMGKNGEQPLGSMGTDTPLAVLSNRPQLLYNYFKQLFAQVTNPPIDPIREELVMSLIDYIGREGNLFDTAPVDARQLKLESPILSNRDLAVIRNLPAQYGLTSRTLATTFPANTSPNSLEQAVDALCLEAERAVNAGDTFLILSDRAADRENAPIPALLALSAVHHHLTRAGNRTLASLIVETGEAREVMHFALLIGYGSSAINPYLALESLADLCEQGYLPEITPDEAEKHFFKAVSKGLLKTFAKMGISTLQSYRGAQIFEAVGLNTAMVDHYFTGTPSRLSGINLDIIQKEALSRHAFAYPSIELEDNLDLETGGQYQWRRSGEYHMYNPESVAKLQHATSQKSYATFKEFSKAMNDTSKNLATLRGLLKFKPGTPIPLEEVEPTKNIVKRFVTGAMSLGSISREAHETLAIAMNRLGGKSNTGEGGEDPVRYTPDANGDSRRSAIKQVASGRFGVTAHYLVNADELQIKMAQGAKPGEGGELPGHKVDRYIAKVRHTTPGVTLVSPPPHHDIYSIEDLAQLIFDLKNINHHARISVKLVSEVGVGTVAAGVSKAHADHVLISGHDGGTGASPISSIKHAGLPWEMGLAETQQVLVKNDLRGRIYVQTDGQLKTGRDVAVAALLGAEEFGFSTAPLVTMGCIMMRVCHLGTCPVGIATQDAVLRERFSGQPENVINFFFFVAEELREIMAELGFHTVEEMVGRMDRLDIADAVDHWKTHGIDLRPLLTVPDVPPTVPHRRVISQDHGLEAIMDQKLIELCRPALDEREPISLDLPIINRDRTTATMLSGEIARKYGEEGLPEGTIQIKFTGSAGQSLGAFLAPGISLTLEGDANDYLGKGMSGGRIVVYPPRSAPFDPTENIVAGNTILYGATAGEVYLRGVVGERFAVRNSGATAVVEGTGDHCCEYMTGGVVVVLGKTGRNFAAGMSGGVAYVWDPDETFKDYLNDNHGIINLDPVSDERDREQLHSLITRHLELTRSDRAAVLLQSWERSVSQFKKVISKEFIRAQMELEAETSGVN